MIKTLSVLAAIILIGPFAAGQKAVTGAESAIPTSTQALLSGVKSPESKSVIRSVLKIQCPKDHAKGTGFAISGGNVVTTNSHVVGSCRFEDLVGTSAVSNEPVTFSGMVRDTNRYLALLCTTKPLPFLKLSSSERPQVETEVETWGYPLAYENRAPILSRGYVAGYLSDTRPLPDGGARTHPVEHLIVNGAINPGNSGGPLIDRATGKVTGIVVEKWILFSPNVESALNGLKNPKTTLLGDLIPITYPNGEVKNVTQQEATRVALEEIYEKSQVMIGEAISVSELNAFVNEKQHDLATCSAH